jgi:hypothetical protein
VRGDGVPGCRYIRCHVTPIWGWYGVYELEGVLGPSIMKFVEQYVRSLLTWDILVFFHRNPDAVLDLEGLASRLGRRIEELQPEIDELCKDKILQCALIRYRPSPELRETVGKFVEACQERGRRLALIALVLHKINPRTP